MTLSQNVTGYYCTQYDSELEIECYSSSLDTSYFDSDSCGDEVCEKEPQTGSKFRTIFSSDKSEDNSNKEDSSGSEAVSNSGSEEDESEHESDDESSEIVKTSLTPRKHCVVVTRKRLSDANRNLLRKRRIINYGPRSSGTEEETTDGEDGSGDESCNLEDRGIEESTRNGAENILFGKEKKRVISDPPDLPQKQRKCTKYVTTCTEKDTEDSAMCNLAVEAPPADLKGKDIERDDSYIYNGNIAPNEKMKKVESTLQDAMEEPGAALECGYTVSYDESKSQCRKGRIYPPKFDVFSFTDQLPEPATVPVLDRKTLKPQSLPVACNLQANSNNRSSKDDTSVKQGLIKEPCRDVPCKSLDRATVNSGAKLDGVLGCRERDLTDKIAGSDSFPSKELQIGGKRETAIGEQIEQSIGNLPHSPARDFSSCYPCSCDQLGVGMLLKPAHIKKKAWPLRIERLLLSAIQSQHPLPSSCRFCDETEDPRVKEILSKSCSYSTWAFYYWGSKKIHAIPIVRTEVLKRISKQSSLYACRGQCGITLCNMVANSVADLRQHVKNTAFASIKYSGWENRAGGVQDYVITEPISAQEANKCLREEIGNNSTIRSDESKRKNLMNSQSSSDKQKGNQETDLSPKDATKSKYLNEIELKLKGFDIRILQLIRLFNSNETDFLIDMLINCFYNSLSCQDCWKKGKLGRYLPNIWSKIRERDNATSTCSGTTTVNNKGVQSCVLSCSKFTSTDDLLSLMGTCNNKIVGRDENPIKISNTSNEVTSPIHVTESTDSHTKRQAQCVNADITNLNKENNGGSIIIERNNLIFSKKAEQSAKTKIGRTKRLKSRKTRDSAKAYNDIEVKRTVPKEKQAVENNQFYDLFPFENYASKKAPASAKSKQNKHKRSFDAISIRNNNQKTHDPCKNLATLTYDEFERDLLRSCSFKNALQGDDDPIAKRCNELFKDAIKDAKIENRPCNEAKAQGIETKVRSDTVSYTNKELEEKKHSKSSGSMIDTPEQRRKLPFRKVEKNEKKVIETEVRSGLLLQTNDERKKMLVENSEVLEYDPKIDLIVNPFQEHPMKLCKLLPTTFPLPVTETFDAVEPISKNRGNVMSIINMRPVRLIPVVNAMKMPPNSSGFRKILSAKDVIIRGSESQRKIRMNRLTIEPSSQTQVNSMPVISTLQYSPISPLNTTVTSMSHLPPASHCTNQISPKELGLIQVHDNTSQFKDLADTPSVHQVSPQRPALIPVQDTTVTSVTNIPPAPHCINQLSSQPPGLASLNDNASHFRDLADMPSEPGFSKCSSFTDVQQILGKPDVLEPTAQPPQDGPLQHPPKDSDQQIGIHTTSKHHNEVELHPQNHPPSTSTEHIEPENCEEIKEEVIKISHDVENLEVIVTKLGNGDQKSKYTIHCNPLISNPDNSYVKSIQEIARKIINPRSEIVNVSEVLDMDVVDQTAEGVIVQGATKEVFHESNNQTIINSKSKRKKWRNNFKTNRSKGSLSIEPSACTVKQCKLNGARILDDLRKQCLEDIELRSRDGTEKINEKENTAVGQSVRSSDTKPSRVRSALKMHKVQPIEKRKEAWMDSIKVESRGSTVFLKISDLKNNYEDIIYSIAKVLLVLPNEIRSVQNVTQSTTLRASPVDASTAFVSTLRCDDILSVKLRRPTEASDQKHTSAEAEIHQVHNILLFLVKFPVVEEPATKPHLQPITWITNRFVEPDGNGTLVYQLSDGTNGSFMINHVTYLNRRETFAIVNFRGVTDVTSVKQDVSIILNHFKRHSLACGTPGEASGESRDTAVESRDTAGESRDTAGKSRDTAEESRDTAGESRDMLYLKYWYQGGVFSCYLLSSGTIQVDFFLSLTSVVLDLKKDYVCQINSGEVTEEASLSFTVLSTDLADKLAFMANVALPAVLADVSLESGSSL